MAAKKKAKADKKGKSPAKGPGKFAAAVAASEANGSPPLRKPVERRRFKEKLPVKIAAEAVAEKGDALAKVIHERNEMLEEQRESNSGFRERRAYFDQRLDELADSIESKTEIRLVPCIEYLIAETNEIQVVRQDTGEVVPSLSRIAEGGDRQEALKLNPDEDEDGENAVRHNPDEDDDLGDLPDPNDDEIPAAALADQGEDAGDARAGDRG